MSEQEKMLLLIDDDEVDRHHVFRMMAGPYEVTSAELGEEGLELFLDRRPDCVLLDYRLPDVNEFELLDKLVCHGAAAVMLTGHGNEQVAVDAMKRGAHDVVNHIAEYWFAMVKLPPKQHADA